VLLVGVNYWPEPTGIAPYTTELAEYLAGRGARVQALTGMPCYPGWAVHHDYRGLRIREQRNGVQVLRVAHFVPKRQDAARRAAYELSFLAHAGAARGLGHPNLVVGVTPALAGAAVAARLARRHNASLMLIVQDLVGAAAAQSGIAGGRRVAAAANRLEGWVLRQADQVVVISDGFRAPVLDHGVLPEVIRHVPNWSRIATSTTDRRITRAMAGWRDGETIALHTGNMGLKQDLGNIVEAARLTRHRTDLRWVLMGDGSQREQLRRQGHGLPNLDFLPLCDEDRYPDVLAAADVLLLNERAGVTEMSLPSKLTSYFASGRPVAGAVMAEGAAARELSRAGAPEPVPPGDPAALVRLVEHLGTAGEAYGRRALDYARTHLTPDAALAQLIAALP
jgi:colanic acid biosynthesis glycosyl transferase WcaI